MQQKIEGADKLMVWHNNDRSKGDRCTLAVIWKGEQRFVGIAAVSERDVFNRKKGREIAIGRAKHLFEVESGKRASRESDKGNKLMQKFLVNQIPEKLQLPEFLFREVPRIEGAQDGK